MRDQFVGLLLSQVGQHEGRDPDGTWNNHQRYSAETPGLEWSQDQPWCATFQAWGAHRLGMDTLWPMTASCSAAVEWWQGRGRWSDYPVLGGPFYLGPGGGTHTGVVVAYDADTITTVEGNSNPGGSANGDGVYKRTRPRRGSGSPYGYGVPAYPEGTISADPRLGGTRSAAVQPPASTTNVQEDDMPLSDGDINKLRDVVVAAVPPAVWNYNLPNLNADGTPTGTSKSAYWWLIWQDVFQARTEAAIKAAKLTPEEIQQALADGTLKVEISVAPATTKGV